MMHFFRQDDGHILSMMIMRTTMATISIFITAIFCALVVWVITIVIFMMTTVMTNIKVIIIIASLSSSSCEAAATKRVVCAARVLSDKRCEASTLTKSRFWYFKIDRPGGMTWGLHARAVTGVYWVYQMQEVS